MTATARTVEPAARSPRAGGWPAIRGPRWLLLGAPAFLYLFLFFILPLAALFLRTVQEVPPGAAWYANYAEAASSQVIRNIFVRTFRTGAIVAALAGC